MEKQIITENYAIYNNDCMNVVDKMDNNSIDLSVYSPPFCGLYKYSSSERDMSNNATIEDFLTQYEFLIKEMARITKPGRINAIHCQDIITHTTKHNLYDFPHDIIKIHEKHGFYYRNRITVWKEPLRVRMRTMVQSLMHKKIVEDSTECFTAVPDYVLIFVKAGENKIPVTHDHGLKKYHGQTPVLPEMCKKFNKTNETNFDEFELWEYLNNTYYKKSDPRSNKLSHYIWQRYASSVWDDIRPDEVLKFKESKEEDDEKHVHPLQLDIINRLIELYSNPKEIVFTPFMGVGSEVFSAVANDRKGIGVELKESYYKQAIKNMQSVKEYCDFLSCEDNSLF
ncbi:MAG: site-specific DNA-methyltransferase [Bacteroidales bacterium]|jgi:DNA modification methylase|nr:site-specific DNA-methyltransferase [Bacteroidales bacterium]